MVAKVAAKWAVVVPYERISFPSWKVILVAALRVAISAASFSILSSQYMSVEAGSPKSMVVPSTLYEPKMLLQPAFAEKLPLSKEIDPVLDSQVNRSSTAITKVLIVTGAGAWRVTVPPTSAAAGVAVMSTKAMTDPEIICFIYGSRRKMMIFLACFKI